jgi:group I intron endonuclease
MRSEIYALTDPEDGRVRYVGQSVQVFTRFNQHLQAASKGASGRVYNWIRALAKFEKEPMLVILQVCRVASADALERKWVRKFRSSDLTNLTDGGSGNAGYRHTEETKKKIGDAHRGKLVSSATREKISESQKGKKLSAEHSAILQAYARDREVTDSERAAISARMMGNKHSLGRRRSQEEIGRMIATRDASPPAQARKERNALAVEKVLSGQKQKDVAAELGMTRATVCNLMKSWKVARDGPQPVPNTGPG